MAHGSGSDLLYWRAAAPQPKRVVFCRQITDESSNASAATQNRQRRLEEGRLTRPRTRDDAHDVDVSFPKGPSQVTRKQVILLENAFPHFDNPRLRRHSISIRITSRSSPSVSSTISREPPAPFPPNERLNKKFSAFFPTPARAPPRTKRARPCRPP